MNFGDPLSDGSSHPRTGRTSSGPPPGGGRGPRKNLSGFMKGVGSLGNVGQIQSNSPGHNRRNPTPESLVDDSDPNHNNMFGGIPSLTHDLSFLEDIEDQVPIPPGDINLKVLTKTRKYNAILIIVLLHLLVKLDNFLSLFISILVKRQRISNNDLRNL